MKKLTTQELVKMTENSLGKLVGTFVVEGITAKSRFTELWKTQSPEFVTSTIENIEKGKLTGELYPYEELGNDEEMRFAFKVLIDESLAFREDVELEGQEIIRVKDGDKHIYIMKE